MQKIQIFQIKGKNSKSWLCSDIDNKKTNIKDKMKQFGQSITEIQAFFCAKTQFQEKSI